MSILRRVALFTLLSLPAGSAFANGGTVGYSGVGGFTCNACHGGGGGGLTLTGPTSTTGGQTVTYTINGSPNAIDIAIDNKLATITPTTQSLMPYPGELTSRNNGPWTFTIKVPHIGGTVKLFASGVTGNALGSPTSNLAGTTITFAATAGPPLIVNPAKAAETSFTGKTTTVSVLGIDDTPESTITYTWSATGPGTATFTPNGTNAAKNSTASFSTPGKYTVTATLTDPSNLSSTSSVEVTVGTVVSSIVVTPSDVGIPPGSTQQFTAQGKDQFGGVIANLPDISWSVTPGGGSINPTTGVFKAANAPGTSVVISAQSGTMRAVANVTIANGTAPKITPDASAVMNGLSAALSVGATDAAGEAGLTYTWSAIAGAGTVTFSTNGNNAAKKTTATFSAAGTYKIQVQVKNAAGLTANQTLTVNAGAAGSTNPPVTEGGSGTGNGTPSTQAPATPGATADGAGCTSAGGLALWAALAALPGLLVRRRSRRTE